MKSKNSTGYMVMFLETDLKYAKKFDETTLSPVQKAVYEKISESEREKVRQGYGVSVIDLETGDTICVFNKDTYRPPKRAIEELARALLPEIVEFYKDENNRKEFEEWKKNQDEKINRNNTCPRHPIFFINIIFTTLLTNALYCAIIKEPNGSLYFGGHFMRSRDESLFGKIIDFVNEYFEDYGRSPSTREIEQGIGASRPTIQRYLKTLQEQGEIEYDGHRGIVTQYMRELMDTNRVQMGNSIPCGPLTEVTDAELEHIRLPLALTGSGDFFLLRANGESMINVGIDDGDLVLIRKQETAREGQIVAVLYNSDCTTLKRFHRESEREVHLIPENDSMQPIILKGEQLNALKIQGVATMVMKDLDS